MTLTLTPTRGVEPRVPRGGRTRASAPPRRRPTSPPLPRPFRLARELDHLLQLPQPLRGRRLQPDLAVELRLLVPSGELFGRLLRVSHESSPTRRCRVDLSVGRRFSSSQSDRRSTLLVRSSCRAA